MANENELRDRWNERYHASSEYQNALKHDAISGQQRDAEYRQRIRQALTAGDSGHAAKLQSQMMDDWAAQQQGDSGHAAGLDAFQNNRVADYITQARTSGARQAAQLRGGDTVAYGSNYLAQLDNPDFSTHFPYANVRASGTSSLQSTRGHAAPTVDHLAKTPAIDPNTRQKFAWERQDMRLHRLAEQNREAQLVSSLPNELTGVYKAKVGAMTPYQKTAWMAQTPDVKYSQLRGWAKNPSAIPGPIPSGSGTAADENPDDFMPSVAPTIGGDRPTADVLSEYDDSESDGN